MNKKRLAIVAGTYAAVAVVGFCLGWRCNQRPPAPPSDLSVAIATLKPGDTLTLTERDTRISAPTRSEVETGASRQITASDKGTYNRGLSWWGLGGPEAASQHQGMTIDGGEFVGGSHRGTGILERWWSWLKSVFWVGVCGLVILFVLTFIPATSGIAGKILRVLAAIPPIIGSVVERAVSQVKAVKPLEQVVEGGEEFKDAVAKLPERLPTETGEAYTVGQKAEIKRVFQNAHGETQTGTTPAIVKAITG